MKRSLMISRAVDGAFARRMRDVVAARALSDEAKL